MCQLAWESDLLTNWRQCWLMRCYQFQRRNGSRLDQDSLALSSEALLTTIHLSVENLADCVQRQTTTEESKEESVMARISYFALLSSLPRRSDSSKTLLISPEMI